MMPAPAAQLASWLSVHPTLIRRVVVPATLKWEVRDKLDQANFTERTLFPGLEGLSRWLARYYWPRKEARRKEGARPTIRLSNSRHSTPRVRREIPDERLTKEIKITAMR